MKVKIMYSPPLKTLWLKLPSAWITRIEVAGSLKPDYEWYTETKPTSRQIRRWKKQVNIYETIN